MTSRQRWLFAALFLATTALADVESETEALQGRLNAFAQSSKRGGRGLFADSVTATPPPAVLRLGPGRPVGWLTEYQGSIRPPRAVPRKALVAEQPWILQDLTLRITRSQRRGEHLLARIKLSGRRDQAWVNASYDAVVQGDLVTTMVLKKWRECRAKRTPFVDVAKAAGMAATDPAVLDHPTLGLAAYGAAAADVDGDGRIDLLSTAHDTNRLYLNRGNGKFQMVEIKSPRQATGPLFLDFDNDGDADLFLSANGKQMLLENRLVPDGKLAFKDVSEAQNIAVRSLTFSAVAGDINGDRRPDIYVAAYNNYGPVAPDNWNNAHNGLPNLLFVTQPDGTYREEAKKWGVADTRWSYAAQFVDLDEDKRLDLYVANDFGAGNALFLNRGGRFEDVARARGVRESGYSMGVSFGDIDNDGRLDLHVTRMSSKAGNRILARGGEPGANPLSALASGNGLYRQEASGRFTDVTKSAGPFPAGWAWGGGFLDIDNDGFQDLYVPNGHLSGTLEADT